MSALESKSTTTRDIPVSEDEEMPRTALTAEAASSRGAVTRVCTTSGETPGQETEIVTWG